MTGCARLIPLWSTLRSRGKFEDEDNLILGRSGAEERSQSGLLVREIAKSIGGSGGGDQRFAQGGVDKRPDSIPDIRAILLNSMSAKP